jgi:hypothetical protein
MAYHHFDDPTGMTKILASFLKPGGYLVVADNEKSDANPPQATVPGLDIANEAVPHLSGFTSKEFSDMVEAGGLNFNGYVHAATIDASAINLPSNMEIFLGTAIKPVV